MGSSPPQDTRLYTPSAIAVEFDVRAQRLVRWIRDEVLHATMHTVPGWRDIGPVTLFTLDEATLAATVATLRDEYDVPLQRISKNFNEIRDRGLPLLNLTFAVAPHGRRHEMFVMRGGKALFGDTATRQSVIQDAVPLRDIRLRLEAMPARPPSTYGSVSIPVGRSEPYVEGTRIRVAAVRSWLDSGADAERILEAYPTLVAADIDAVREAAQAG